jgi:hypothetical protein
LGGYKDISNQSDERHLHQNPGHRLEPIYTLLNFTEGTFSSTLNPSSNSPLQAQPSLGSTVIKLVSNLNIPKSEEKSKPTGEPKPVTGSHPLVTGKPAVPQLEVFPPVISVKPL